MAQKAPASSHETSKDAVRLQWILFGSGRFGEEKCSSDLCCCFVSLMESVEMRRLGSSKAQVPWGAKDEAAQSQS